MTVQEKILLRLGQVGLEQARRATRSTALKRAMRFERVSALVGRIYVPHYWALYHHDGRGSVFPQNATHLIWYRDPSDDPRLQGGYPVRLSEVKKLSSSDVQKGMAENYRRWKSNPGGGKMQFMILAKVSKPTRPGKSYPFFTKGMAGFKARAEEIINQEMISEFQRVSVKDRSTAILRL